jgi:hypothetical protein
MVGYSCSLPDLVEHFIGDGGLFDGKVPGNLDFSQRHLRFVGTAI